MALRWKISPRWTLYSLISVILALLAYTIIGQRGAFHLWRLRAEKARLDEQNYRLQKDNEALRQRISRLRNDNFHLEKMAREELNLVRPGEVIYRFSPSEPHNSRGQGTSEFPSESRPSEARKERR
jgi:cell division protein FtsB